MSDGWFRGAGSVRIIHFPFLVQEEKTGDTRDDKVVGKFIVGSTLDDELCASQLFFLHGFFPLVPIVIAGDAYEGDVLSRLVMLPFL